VLKSQHMLEKGSGSMRKGGIQKYISLMRNLNSPPSHQKCRLHPLIHTIPFENSLQDVGGGSQEASDHKLKYDMFSRTRIANCWAESSTLSVEVLQEEDYK